MKKTAAIFLLVIYLCDAAGYFGMRQYLVYRSACFFSEQTAKGMYNRGDLVDIAIPVNMPGIHDWNAYEKISGQIQFGGNAYNYVQMKITRHTLYLKCVPNYATTRLLTQNIINASPIKDIPVPKKDHVPNPGMFSPHSFIFVYNYATIMQPVIGYISNSAAYTKRLISRHIDIPKQPPKPVC